MQGLILIAGAVALVWGAVVLVRGGPLCGCLAVLVAGTCFSANFFSVDVGPVKLTIDRALWVVVLAVYLVWRQRGWTEPRPVRNVDIVLVSMMAYFALRTFMVDGRVTSSAPVVHLVLWYVMPLGLYWIARGSRLTERHSLLILVTLSLLGIYLAVTVAAEYFQAYALVFPKYIVTTLDEQKYEFVGRGRGPLLNPMGTGILLGACWAAALLWCGRWKRYGPAAIVALSLLFLLAAWCTMTRSVWMGAGLSVAVIAATTLPKPWRMPLLGGAVVVGALALATHWNQVVAFKRDRGLTAADTADSVYLRPVMAVIAWNMFQDRPWMGCGFDQYREEHCKYLADRSSGLNLERARRNTAHNVLIAIVTETGLIGLGLFVALLLMWSRDAWRLWRSEESPLWARQQGLVYLAMLSAYLVNGMFHHVGCIPVCNPLLFFTAGVVAAGRAQPARSA